MPASSSLIIRAGPKAMEHIRRNGLSPQDVAVIPGAAGGPKALGIIGFDHTLFGEWLPRAPRVRDLIGVSIGAWRFAGVCRGDIADALKDFGDIYVGQTYPPRPSPAMVSESAHTNTRGLIGGHEAKVLSHPHYRLHVIATRGRGPLNGQSTLRTPSAFVLAGLVNAFGRKHLRHLADRMWFHDPRGMPGFMGDGTFDTFQTFTASLTTENLHPSLWASAAIPTVMLGVENIAGAPPGTYWDGGIIDYHLHLPYHRADGITLYPHFTDRLIPGWLDKPFRGRVARDAWLENMVMISPSAAYLAKLPHGKLPDRSDFKRYEHDYESRRQYWRTAMAESARLGDEFLQLVESGEIAARLQPL